MSERTTIGGVVYETVGSSNSNLLLKCNGTVRILWGSTLIDLIKKGKIAAGSSSDPIYVVSNAEDISKDGIYVVSNDSSNLLWICKNKKQYNLTGTDLYISTIKQELTAEQKFQAAENLGLYFNTLEEVTASGIKNGLVYVSSDRKLYTVTDGTVEEFQATIKSVAVEQENLEEGKIINSSVKIVLSVANKPGLSISEQEIVVDTPINISSSVALGSTGSDKNFGYRLYVENNTSYLDIDIINARKWSPFCRGMIMLFSDLETIPEGWAKCDGLSHQYKDREVVTPNLSDRFIPVETDQDGSYNLIYIIKL